MCINNPSVELIEYVGKVANTTGATLDKFKEFSLKLSKASHVQAPLLTECFANLECKLKDTSMLAHYDMFIFEVVNAWIIFTKKRPQMIHHCGNGVFTVDGDEISLSSKMK